MRRVLEIGGMVTAVVLIAFGVAAIAMGFSGRSTVSDSLKQEQITGTPDMTPAGIKAEVSSAKAAQAQLISKLQAAGVKITPSPISAPSCSVAGKSVDNGTEARCFARYMRIHTFGATSGLTYSQMGRFLAKPSTPIQYTDGLGGTSDPTKAMVDPKTKQPVDNGRRDIWVTYTALTTALNTSYMASQLALFAVVVGFALLLTGIGFGILAVGGALRNRELAVSFGRQKAPETGTPVTA
jgi:F0F1-type ATP synthase membrane subunit c/vacuolar-type H+-ATPase subunit K